MKPKRRFKFRAEQVLTSRTVRGPWRASYDKARADFIEPKNVGSIEIAEVKDDEVFFYGVFISLTEIGVKRKEKNSHQ